jgi:hypothetical protein
MLLTPKRSDEIKAKIQAAVEAALLDREVSARRASLDVVGNDGLIRDLRAGRLPGVDRLEALFEYLGLEFYLGPHRPRISGFAEPAGSMSGMAPPEPPRAGYLPIPWHPDAPRTGGQPAPPMAFGKAWLEAAGLDPGALAVVRTADPADGSEIVALVETAARRRGGPARWCYREGGRVALARVQFDPDVTVIFGNADDAPARVMVGEDRGRVTFLGRVVWSGRLDHGETSPSTR